MWRFIRYLVVVYGLLCVGFHYYQHLFFFQPKALSLHHAFTFPVQLRFSEAKIPFDEHTLIDVVRFEPPDSQPKGVVLFFHGNRFNVEHYSTYAPYFTKHGYEVWMPDYPGYGRSTGEINQAVLQELAVQLYTMARAKYEPTQIVAYGKSLGTGVAAHLAAVRDCRHVLLETPYYSLSSLAQSYAWFLPASFLVKHNLQPGKSMERITAPVTLMAAVHDELIPLHNTLRLAAKLKPIDAIYFIADATHNGLPQKEEYFRIIDSVMTR